MTIGDTTGIRRVHAVRRYLMDRVRVSVDALEHLVGGLGTALLALAALTWVLAVALSCVVGVGVLLMPSAVRVVRAVGDRERARLSRWGTEIISPAPAPAGLRAALRDQAVRREFAWLVGHATFGFAIGLIGLALPLYAVQSLTFPLWFWLVPR